MKVTEFVQKFQQDKIQNTKINPNAVSEYLKNVLEIKTYILNELTDLKGLTGLKKFLKEIHLLLLKKNYSLKVWPILCTGNSMRS